MKSVSRFMSLALFGLVFSAGANAQQPDRPSIVTLGNAVVTGFSGTVAPDPKQRRPAKKTADDLTFINPDGPSARVVDLARPGRIWDGSVFAAPKTFNVLAKDVGQVFGVALDDAPQPNIYVAATSAFGLNLVARGRDGKPERRKKGGPGTGWMKGQFGLDLQGGPGAIYKIDGRTGVPTLFANVTLDGVPNPAPGLGNLAYDAPHKQLFVSDLYTGMIHRFDLDGKELDRYDHGVTGLTAANLAPVAFNPNNRPNIASDRFDSEKPDTWGYAPAQRRVWGLTVHEGRLFYSVVSGPQIWSVGILRDGRFANDPRWELDVPAQAGPLPISDIAFSNKGAMILAQRALVAGSYDYSAFTRPGEPQVFRIWLKGPQDPPSPGRWKLVPEEYAVGFAGNYRNTNGGVALGYGYDRDGLANGNACEFSLWTTAQNMRNAPPLKTRLDPGGALVVHGIQGLPASPVRDINTPPWLSYSVGYGDTPDDPKAAGHLGSVRIDTKPCNAFQVYSGPGYPASPPYIVTVVGPPPLCVGSNCSPPPNCSPNCPPLDNPIDIGIAKIGETNPNNPDGAYNFTIGIRNMAGPITTSTALTVTDVVPAGMTFTSITATNWSCLPLAPVSGGTTLTCTYTGTFPIAANQILGSISIVADGGNGPYENCAQLGQTDGNSSNDKACVTVRKDYGNLTVVKEVENKTQPHVSTVGLVYPVAVTCGSTVTNLNLVEGLPQTVGPIAYGTLCKVVEGTPPLPTGACPAGQLAWTMPPTYLPSDSVTIASGINATIRVRNKLECAPSGGGGDGYVLLKKEVVSGLQGYAAPPLTFPVNVTCTNGTSGTFNLSSDGTAQAVGNLPIGTSCTVNEPSVTINACPVGMTTVWGPVAYHPSNTASAAMPGPTVTVTNPFTCEPAGNNLTGGIEVKKVVTNRTDPHVPISSSISFAIGTSCQLGTSPAVATPMPMLDGGSQTITGLAYNTKCDVTEAPPAPPALGPAGCITPGYVPVWTTVLPPQVTINAPMTTVTVQNFLDCVPPGGGDTGSLVVTKVIDNKIIGAPLPSGLQFPVKVTCGTMPPTNLLLSANVPQTVSNLPVPTSCQVEETSTPTVNLPCAIQGQVPTWTTTISPSSPVQVNGPNTPVTVTNRLECGGGNAPTGYVLVKKEVVSGVQGYTAPPATFAVNVTCNGNTTALSLSSDGTPKSVGSLPTGTQCTINEPTPTHNACPTGQTAVWGTPTYHPSNTANAAMPGPTVTVTNPFTCRPGQPPTTTLTVDKKVTNNTNIPIPTGTLYAISTSCVSGMSPAVVTGMPLGNHGSQTVSGLTSGTVCTISETPPALPPIPPGSCWTATLVPVWTTLVPPPVTIGTAPATATVENILDCKPKQTSQLLLQKVVVNKGGNAPLPAQTFPVTATCGGNATTLNMVDNTTQTVGQVPYGSCTINEPTPPVLPGSCPRGYTGTWSSVYPATVAINQSTHVVNVTNTLTCTKDGGIGGPPPIVCKSPLIASAVPGQCMCPSGTVQRGGNCVKVAACKAPMVPGTVAGECVCPSGMRKVGARCVQPLVCHEPAKLNSRGTACVCPKGMTKKGNSCVEQARKRDPKPERKPERQRPGITGEDVLRVLPGLIGPGGFGGGRPGGDDGGRKSPGAGGDRSPGVR